MKQQVRNDFEPGLVKAICGLSFFQHRWTPQKRFKNPTRKHNAGQLANRKTVWQDQVQMARHFIREARALGWRGSIRERQLAGAEGRQS